MTPAQLLAAATEVATRFPAAELVKNEVGNLAIMNGGVYAGYLDLRDGTAVVFTDEFGGDRE
jgi:hypothetical protein